MKYAMGLLTIAFAVYAGIQSYGIAQAGAAYGIPQLEGDGGGGLVFTALCLVSGVLAMIRPLWSWFACVPATLCTLIVGVYYADNTMLVWMIAPLLMGAVCTVLHVRERRVRHSGGLAQSP